jgi:hypothetical protein
MDLRHRREAGRAGLRVFGPESSIIVTKDGRVEASSPAGAASAQVPQKVW